MNRDYNYRRYKRYVKGIKRIREDRAQHGNDHSCDCFCPDTDKGRGQTFSRFADYPKSCSCWMCTNDSSKEFKAGKYIPDE